MEIIVGTESTWSLRAWICLQLVNVDVSEHVIDLSSAHYKSEILKYTPTGLVPVLIIDTLLIHDSLAITEYLNEYSNGSLFPTNISDRAVARSLCAEMHSGFMNLRKECSFTLEPVVNSVEMTKGLSNELTRIEAIFKQAEIPYMFASVGAVDAFYSILAFRLKSYGISLQGKAGEYQECLLNWSLLKRAITQAKQWENAKS